MRELLARTKGTLVLEDESGLSRSYPSSEGPGLRRGRRRLCSGAAWGKRERLSTIGRHHTQGQDILPRPTTETIKSGHVIEYLSRLLREIHAATSSSSGTTARPHTSHMTKEFLERIRKRLTVFYLPPYFPKLNPTEYLWTYIKWDKMKNYCPMDLPQLRRKLYTDA